MRRVGWIEGQAIFYDRTYADDRHRDLPRLAAELVANKPELTYAPPQIAAMAARQVMQAIPIVFATGVNPVGAGLVASLSRSGGNVTGVLSVIDSLAPKRLELLREIIPLRSASGSWATRPTRGWRTTAKRSRPTCWEPRLTHVHRAICAGADITFGVLSTRYFVRGAWV